jgi:hypothetical protein
MGGKRMNYDFQERLEFSKGARQESDLATIMSLLDGCSSVTANNTDGNDNGIDYIATLRRGAEIFIDAKTRQKGCSRFWKNNEPELAIERWSVMPGGKFNTTHGKAGWTLDESKPTDMILYTFDSADCTTAFLFPFQSLRMAARRMVQHWMKRYKVDIQTSNNWQSQAVFVPASEVIAAMETTFSATVEITDSNPPLQLIA